MSLSTSLSITTATASATPPSEQATPTSTAWLKRDAMVLAPNNDRSIPLTIVRGEGCYVWDADGQRYLDMHAGLAVMSVGHTHPAVVQAIQQQATQLTHYSSTDFCHPPQVELAERLCQLVPWMPSPQVCFTLGGADSMEAAIKLAKLATQRSALITFEGSFHGRSTAALSVTTSKLKYKQGFGSLLNEVFVAPYPYQPRLSQAELATLAAQALHDIEHRLFKHHIAPERVAAFIIEPIQGEGGYRQAHPSFYSGLQTLASRYGILLVMDEVQTGLGRTGHWWASQALPNVTPDILLCAKGLASGLPLGAVLASQAVFAHFYAMAHASTFTANPIACQAALATLNIIDSDNLQHNARERGQQLYDGLQQLSTQFEFIHEVRGPWGLMLGIECHDTPTRDALLQILLEKHHIITVGCGEQSFRLCPALTITAADIQQCIEALWQACYTFQHIQLG